MALTEDQRKCWAFAETMELQPWRIEREQWQIYNGKDWVAAPPDFAVTEARSLPAGFKRKVSRTTGQVYYFNTSVRTNRLPAHTAGPCGSQPCRARPLLRGVSEYMAVVAAERQEPVGVPREWGCRFRAFERR